MSTDVWSILTFVVFCWAFCVGWIMHDYYLQNCNKVKRKEP